jgi:hypothetical protein
MNRKPAFLLLALALGLSPLLPGVASADGGHGRGYDSYRYSHGRHDRGHGRYDYDKHDYHRHAKRHHRKHYHAPRVVYRDRLAPRYIAEDSLTIIFNGRLR